MFPYDSPDVGFVMPEFHPVDRDPSFVDVDFVCSGDEFADKGAITAIVSTCENCSRKCHVSLVVMDVSQAMRNKIRKVFDKLCPGHVLDIVDPPRKYDEFMRTYFFKGAYGCSCLKLFLTEICDHYNDVFVYNDCDTLTVGDVSEVVDLCKIHGVGTDYMFGCARDMNCDRSEYSKYMSGFFVGSTAMIKAGGYVESVVKLVVINMPIMHDMYYFQEPACTANRILEITPSWVFLRFMRPGWRTDPNKFYGVDHPCVGYETYDPNDEKRFVKCYHFSGPKPWAEHPDESQVGIDAWKECHDRCERAAS